MEKVSFIVDVREYKKLVAIIEPMGFTWASGLGCGFIQDEVDKIIKELVFQRIDGVNRDPNEVL